MLVRVVGGALWIAVMYTIWGPQRYYPERDMSHLLIDLGAAKSDTSTKKEEEVANVQQTADIAFYKKGNAWIDSRAITEDVAKTPAKEVDIGSKEFGQLVDRLVATGRQSCLNLGTGLEVVVDDTRYRIR